MHLPIVRSIRFRRLSEQGACGGSRPLRTGSGRRYHWYQRWKDGGRGESPRASPLPLHAATVVCLTAARVRLRCNVPLNLGLRVRAAPLWWVPAYCCSLSGYGVNKVKHWRGNANSDNLFYKHVVVEQNVLILNHYIAYANIILSEYSYFNTRIVLSIMKNIKVFN